MQKEEMHTSIKFAFKSNVSLLFDGISLIYANEIEKARAQCDKIGQFLKVDGTNFDTKIAKMSSNIVELLLKNGIFI